MIRTSSIAILIAVLLSISGFDTAAAKPTVNLARQTISFVDQPNPKGTKNLKLQGYSSGFYYNPVYRLVHLESESNLDFELSLEKSYPIELTVSGYANARGGAIAELEVEVNGNPLGAPVAVAGSPAEYKFVIPASLLKPSTNQIYLVTPHSAPATIYLSSVSIYSDSATWLGLTDEQFATDTSYRQLAVDNDAEFAWRLFLRANRTVSKSTERVRHWEASWATNKQTFPSKGAPVAWADVESQLQTKEFGTPFLAQILDPKTAVVGVSKTEETALGLGTVVEEIRRNRDTYDYIRTNGYFCADIVAGGTAPSFPHGAVELKAEWRKGKAADASRYYTAQYKGDTYLLIGFHLMSKALPTWFWATWEHVDNPLRGKLFTSQHDAFGVAKKGKLTTQLQDLFADAGMDASLWGNYRLVNWQNDYDNPTVAGNSVIEGTLTHDTSSCIACHKIASATGATRAATPAGDVVFPKPDYDLLNGKKVSKTFENVTIIGATKPTKVTLDFTKIGYLGNPPTATVPANGKGTTQKVAAIGGHPFDFVWSLFRAKQHGVKSCKGVGQ